jgi:hypothetical protein
MSLLNIALTDHCAWVYVDTESKNPLNGEALASTKVFPIAHARMVLAGRGNLNFMTVACYSTLCFLMAFDEIEPHMCSVLDETFVFAIANNLAMTADQKAAQAQQEIALVGWSASRGRMVGRWYSKESLTEGFRESPIKSPGTVTPWDDALGAPPVFHAPETARWLADKQVRWAHVTHPDQPIGGSLIEACITQDEVKIAIRHHLPARQGVALASESPRIWGGL